MSRFGEDYMKDAMERNVVQHFKLYKKRYATRRDLGPNWPTISFVRKYAKGKKYKILDVGCGAGNLLENLHRYIPDAKLCGVDLTPELVREARQSNKNAKILVGSVYNLPFKSGSFDAVIAEDLLHHLVGSTPGQSRRNILKALKNTFSALREGGLLIIKDRTVSSKSMSWLTFYMTLICSKLRLKVSHFDIREGVIIYFLEGKELKDILTRTGFQILEFKVLTRPWLTLREVLVVCKK